MVKQFCDICGEEIESPNEGSMFKLKALRKVLENWRDAHADVDDEHGCGLLEDVIWEVDA